MAKPEQEHNYKHHSNKSNNGKTSQAIIAQVVPSADMLGSQHADSTGRKAGIYYLLQNPPPKHPYKNRNSCENNHNQAHTNSYTHAITPSYQVYSATVISPTPPLKSIIPLTKFK